MYYYFSFVKYIEHYELNEFLMSSYICRSQGVFMYVSNLEAYGHLINPETFDPLRTHPDMYELFSNRLDWEKRYISPEYPENFNPNKTHDQVRNSALYLYKHNCNFL